MRILEATVNSNIDNIKEIAKQVQPAEVQVKERPNVDRQRGIIENLKSENEILKRTLNSVVSVNQVEDPESEPLSEQQKADI